MRAEPPETGGDSTGGADTGGAPAAAGKTACELVTRADLVAAGVKGAIAKGKPLQSGIQDDKSSSVCSFDVTLGDLQTNVLVTVAAHGSPDLYDILADDFADVTHEIAGLGTKAEYTADARNLDSDSDHDFGDYSDQQVIVLQGSAVLLVQAPGSRVADEDSLTSLARTLARAAA